MTLWMRRNDSTADQPKAQAGWPGDPEPSSNPLAGCTPLKLRRDAIPKEELLSYVVRIRTLRLWSSTGGVP